MSQTIESHRIKFVDRLYLVIPKCDAQNLLAVSHVDIDRISLDAEVATLQRKVITGIEGLH